MSCSCGASTMEGCPAMQQLAGDEVGVDWDKLHRAMWCLLHPLQCNRDPKTGRPQLSMKDVIVLGAVFFAWHTLTKDS